MENRFYIGPGNWNTDANWSAESGGAGGASFPTILDNAIFDANSGNCTLDADAAALSISVPNYTGTLDAATFDVAIGAGGLDCTDGEGATIVLGSGLWTCAGDFDYEDIGTWEQGTSEWKMTGTANITAVYNRTFERFTVAAGAIVTILLGEVRTYTSGSVFTIDGDVILDGGRIGLGANSQLVGNDGGSISGTGDIYFWPGGDMPTLHDNFSLTCGTIIIYQPPADSVFAPGSGWNCNVQIDNRTTAEAYELRLNGNYNISGDLLIQTNTAGASLNVNNAVFHPNINESGTVTFVENDGTLTYNKGSGTFTLDGDAARDVDFADYDVEALVLAGSDTVTFAGGWTATSFSAQTGDFDPNGQTIETTTAGGGSGDFTIAAGVNLLSSLADVDLWDGVALTVGGVFSAIGNTGDHCNLQGSGGWTLDATAAGTVTNVTVQGSNADVGVDVTASSSTDGSGNSSWIFAAATGGQRTMMGMGV